MRYGMNPHQPPRSSSATGRTCRVDEGAGGLLSAYVRARDADPKSSFGDVVALSRPVDRATAQFLRTVICDAVIAPGFEPGTAAILAAKRDGRVLVLEADPGRVPPAVKRRDVLGVTIEQETPDGFLPFRDNVEYAAAVGVTTIVEPGGLARTGEVADSAAARGWRRHRPRADRTAALPPLRGGLVVRVEPGSVRTKRS